MAHLFSIATLVALISGQAAVVRPPILTVEVVAGENPQLEVKADGLPGVPVPPARVDAVRPLVWRAFARGARVMSLDGVAPRGDTRWMEVAAGIARQFEINGTLLAQCRRGPAVRFEGRAPDGVEVTLLEAQRTFVLVATNASAGSARGQVLLPPTVPYAMWLNLLDGSSMAMLEQDAGPTWAFEMPPWSVKVYVIDKTLK